jgi:para-aminobenzoate synthetase component I
MTIQEFRDTLNLWGQQKIPFLFWIDFELSRPVAIKLHEVNSNEVLFAINGTTNAKSRSRRAGFSWWPARREKKLSLTKHPVSFEDYCNRFNKVLYHLSYGDTFLTNLTTKTEIDLSHSLQELFFLSKAKYKLFVRNQFLVFSPEIFVQIRDGRIYSYPMKGTIDASIPHAAEIILQSEKEKAEHITIVDLIRNDISRVANHVHVSRFRYIDEIKTSQKKLLQVSSEIVGTLPENYRSKLGDILLALLPAGSVSGAPKKKTLEIISQAEQEKRGYYTGVVGCFDGANLDSGVMIRFIEQVGKKMIYRSGGGITTQSDAAAEYQETIDKIYVPVD